MQEEYNERYKNRATNDEIIAIVKGLLGDSYADYDYRWAGYTQPFNGSYLCDIYNDSNAYFYVTIYTENIEDDTREEIAGYIHGFVDAIHPGALYNEKIKEEKIDIIFDWCYTE